MSTRSNIGIERNNGEIDVIYCHFDGYLDGVGQKLLEHYTDIQKIEALVALGGISSLGKEVGERHMFDDHGVAKQLGWTTAYHRDRGEELEISHYPSRAALVQDGYQEYVYLYSTKNNQWYAKDHSKDFKVLTQQLIKASDEDEADDE